MASSKILNYFGLDETAKELVWTLAPESRIPRLFCRRPAEHWIWIPPEKGFYLPSLCRGSAHRSPLYLSSPNTQGRNHPWKKQKTPPEIYPYQLILTIVNRGSSEQVMEAARTAGARGGTVISARRVGYEDVQNLLGFTLQPEKEIVAILVPREQKLPVMQAINREAGLKTDCRGVLFSVPVDDIMGLQELT